MKNFNVIYNSEFILFIKCAFWFVNRHGVRCSLLSPLRYEGTWANGLQDGYGSETYADSGTYQGQWQRGMRHGYGVRQSAPYGGGLATNSTNRMQTDQGLLQSLDTQRSRSPNSIRTNAVSQTLNSNESGRGGFVLQAVPQLGGSESNLQTSTLTRRGSLIDKSNSPVGLNGNRRSGGLLRGLRLKKQKSTGDIDMRTYGGVSGARSVSSSTDSLGGRLQGKNSSSATMLGKQRSMEHGSNASFVSQDADITDPSTTETYMGEWKDDKRCGFGICERSDGLR